MLLSQYRDMTDVLRGLIAFLAVGYPEEIGFPAILL